MTPIRKLLMVPPGLQQCRSCQKQAASPPMIRASIPGCHAGCHGVNPQGTSRATKRNKSHKPRPFKCTQARTSIVWKYDHQGSRRSFDSAFFTDPDALICLTDVAGFVSCRRSIMENAAANSCKLPWACVYRLVASSPKSPSTQIIPNL